MIFNLISAFPHFYVSFLETSLIKKSIESNILQFNLVDLKKFGLGKYKKIDDTPYGGGPGMVIRVDVVDRALKSIKDPGYKILLAPSGKKFTQNKSKKFSEMDTISLICGRYEGFDFRVNSLVDVVISVGDYITMGGEAPSLILIDSISRLIPGVLGDIKSTIEESHSEKYVIEPPIYTRPETYNNMQVPNILLSGDPKKIEDWKNKSGKLRK